jgi:hypothetical protein
MTNSSHGKAVDDGELRRPFADDAFVPRLGKAGRPLDDVYCGICCAQRHMDGHISAFHFPSPVCALDRIAAAGARFLDGVFSGARLFRIGDNGSAVRTHGALPLCHRTMGEDVIYHFHRRISLFAFALVVVHPLIMFSAHPELLAFPQNGEVPLGAVFAFLSVFVAHRVGKPVQDHGPSIFILLQRRGASDGHVEISIRNLGDFTREIPKVPVGQRVYLDGPYGAFTIGNPADMHVLIAGGVQRLLSRSVGLRRRAWSHKSSRIKIQARVELHPT